MPTIVRCGLIQCANPINDESVPVAEIQQAMLDKHIPLIEEAARRGVQILCLQEIFNGPYFCPSQDRRWYAAAEPVPGPTTARMAELARAHNMVIIVPVYEEAMRGVYYNTAAVIDADGAYLGKYRKIHIPQTSGFWEKYFFKPGDLGYPVFQTKYAKIGVYICYDRHFPEGARQLGLGGAEIVFNPSATVAGLSQYLWKLEQPAHAVANGYFVGAINRVGTEAPWGIGRFYGSSYFVDPRGNFLAVASEDQDEVVVADLDLDMIDEVRQTWQFYRDRRPDTYGGLTECWTSAKDPRPWKSPAHPQRRSLSAPSTPITPTCWCKDGRHHRRSAGPDVPAGTRDHRRRRAATSARRHRRPHPHGTALHGRCVRRRFRDRHGRGVAGGTTTIIDFVIPTATSPAGRPGQWREKAAKSVRRLRLPHGGHLVRAGPPPARWSSVSTRRASAVSRPSWPTRAPSASTTKS
jgi:beta-ureidopropionase